MLIGSGSGENFPDPDPTKKDRIRNPGKMCLDENLILPTVYRTYCAGGRGESERSPAGSPGQHCRQAQAINLSTSSLMLAPTVPFALTVCKINPCSGPNSMDFLLFLLYERY